MRQRSMLACELGEHSGRRCCKPAAAALLEREAMRHNEHRKSVSDDRHRPWGVGLLVLGRLRDSPGVVGVNVARHEVSDLKRW